MLAARHGQMVNLSSLATDFGVRVSKIQDFLSIVEGTFLWRQIGAYSANIGKRITRSPRGWIADCGLLHALLDLRGPEDLALHPLAGASWEGWVLGQLLAQASLLDVPPAFAYWRTHAGAEVDIVLEAGHRLIPVEVKRATRVGAYDLRGITSFLDAFSDRAPFGVVLYNGDAALRATDRIALLPIARTL
jgi:predicted AAA+ superfamily ATPase